MNHDNDESGGQLRSLWANRRIALALGIWLGALLGAAAWRQWTPRAIPFVPLEDEAVLERMQLILEEVEDSAQPAAWAGAYFQGDGFVHGVLRVAPGQGYAFSRAGCIGLQGQDHGVIQERGTQLQLVSEFDASRPDSRGSGLQSRLIPVVWGARRYLIAPEQMLAFGNDVSAGVDPETFVERYWVGAVAEGSGEVDGLPSLPAEFAWVLQAEPIRATLLEVLSLSSAEEFAAYRAQALVRMDIGIRTGAYPGMRLDLQDPPEGGFVWAWIQEADPNGSTAILYLDEEDPVPAVGWTFLRGL